MTRDTKILLGVGLGLPSLLAGSYFLFGPNRHKLPSISIARQHQIGMAIGWCVLAFFVLLIIWAAYSTRGKRSPEPSESDIMNGFICQSCGMFDAKKNVKHAGDINIEILLWLFFLIPGLIYSSWRHAARKPHCRACDSISMIPVNTPIVVDIYNRYYAAKK